MKKKAIILSALLAPVLLSCSKQAVSVQEGGFTSEEIVFTAEGEGISVNAETKTTAVTDANLPAFFVNCVTGTLGTSETSVFNVEYMEPSPYKGAEVKKYWPSTNPSYKFYASNISIKPSATGPTVDATLATDVVCAVCSNPTYLSSNALTFNHIFARLGATTVTVQSGYSLSNFTLKITPLTEGTYNLYTGNGKTDRTGWSKTYGDTPRTIATTSGVNTATDIYLVPGTYTLTASYTLTKDAYSVTKTNVTREVALTGGKINAISATLGGASATEITFTVSVTPWGDPVSKNVEFS